MANPRQRRNLIFGLSLGAATAALAILSMVTVVATQPAQAQTFSVVHNFSGGQDGANPAAGLTLDKAGNLYGTAVDGGTGCSPYGCGTVFELKHKGSGWVFNPLYSSISGDGIYPLARVIFGPNSTLYSTTSATSENGDWGTVFNLRPQARACPGAFCSWSETLLYVFQGGTDGANPGGGDLLFDRAGNIYGTTTSGGNSTGDGVVYELTPQSGGGYTENPLYTFSGSDGAYPYNGVIFDNAGNLYGTTVGGGLVNYGAVFELTKGAGGGWTESCLYSFQDGNDGSYPYAGLIFNQSGSKLYGATSSGGTGAGGTVFELTLGANCNWTLATIKSFTHPACGPWGTLVMDGAGNLYGTTRCGGGNEAGDVFKLTQSGGVWTYEELYDFTGGNDGGEPYCSVALDANGNLYGTASAGGSQGLGVVWEITP
jgi:uncharacterized repeat protein (TIGR03803 family)